MSNDINDESKQPNLVAFTSTENNGYTNWYKIGVAWRNDNDSTFIKLGATPVSGNLLLRPREEVEKLREQRNAQAQEKSQDHTISP